MSWLVTNLFYILLYNLREFGFLFWRRLCSFCSPGTSCLLRRLWLLLLPLSRCIGLTRATFPCLGGCLGGFSDLLSFCSSKGIQVESTLTRRGFLFCQKGGRGMHTHVTNLGGRFLALIAIKGNRIVLLSFIHSTFAPISNYQNLPAQRARL